MRDNEVRMGNTCRLKQSGNELQGNVETDTERQDYGGHKGIQGMKCWELRQKIKDQRQEGSTNKGAKTTGETNN